MRPMKLWLERFGSGAVSFLQKNWDQRSVFKIENEIFIYSTWFGKRRGRSWLTGPVAKVNRSTLVHPECMKFLVQLKNSKISFFEFFGYRWVYFCCLLRNRKLLMSTSSHWVDLGIVSRTKNQFQMTSLDLWLYSMMLMRRVREFWREKAFFYLVYVSSLFEML